MGLEIFKRDQKFIYPKSEKIVIGLSLFMVLFACSLYFTNTSFRYYFFKTGESEMYSIPIGKVTMVEGKVQRERAMEGEFNKIQLADQLYPNDTVMTDKGSKVLLELNSGEKIEMSPNSLVKLAFDFEFSMSALIPKKFELQASAIRANAAAGSIKIYKPNEIVTKFTPTQKTNTEPLAFLEMQPPKDSSYSFTRDELRNGKKDLSLSFKTNRAPEGISIHFFQNNGKKELLSKPLPGNATEYRVPVEVRAPGGYYWQIHDTKSNVLAESNFNINYRVLAINALPVLATNNRLKGRSTTNKFDGFTFEWDSPDKKTSFEVTVFDTNTKKVVNRFNTFDSKTIYGKDSIPIRKLFFSVEQRLKSGFIIYSNEQKFGFDYFPPMMTTPEKNAELRMADLGQSQKSIYFTWTKTNYTMSYDIEISDEPKFQKPFIQKNVKDNFFVFGDPKPGTFFWRLRSVSVEQKSDFTDGAMFVIKN